MNRTDIESVNVGWLYIDGRIQVVRECGDYDRWHRARPLYLKRTALVWATSDGLSERFMMLPRDSFRGQVRIHQFHEFSLKAARMKRTVTCRVVDHAGDRRCKHLSDNSTKLSRYAAGIGDNDGFIALLKNH
jgi:hypothetical protein